MAVVPDETLTMRPQRASCIAGTHRGIVDQHVDSAELGQRLLGHRGRGFDVADVGLDRQRPALLFLDLAGDVVAVLAVVFGDHRDRALGGEVVGVAAPDALAAAGDDHHPVLQADIGGVLVDVDGGVVDVADLGLVAHC
jgi:hypothetical protein